MKKFGYMQKKTIQKDGVFKKSTQKRIYQDLVRQIEDVILDGTFKPGDMLPTQRQLSEMFETSRASLREALRVLEQKGLIKIKLGVSGGAVIREVNTEQISEGLALLMRHQKISIAHLSEFREGVEGLVAALAAERCDSADIETLKNLLAESKTHLLAQPIRRKAYDNLDRMIHVAIARISGNPIYIGLIEMIHNNIQYYYENLPLEEERILHAYFEELTKLVGAIERQQSDKAKKLARKHVRRYFEFVRLQKDKVTLSENSF